MLDDAFLRAAHRHGERTYRYLRSIFFHDACKYMVSLPAGCISRPLIIRRNLA